MDGQPPQLEAIQAADLTRALFNEAGDALLIVEPLSERLLDINPMALKLSGLGRDALLLLTVREVVRHEQGSEDWLETVRQTGSFHGQDGFLLRTQRLDVWIPVSLSISRLHPPGTAPLALFMVRDRREQVEAYRRLQRTEAELRHVLTSVSDCLWSCRVEPKGRWRYRYLSPVVERITGRPVSFFLDDPLRWTEVVVPEDQLRWREFRTWVAAGNSTEIEYRIRRPDRSTGWVRESVVAAPGLHAEAAGLLLHGILTDVTARKQVEQAALERNLLEAQKLESLGVLAGGIAHDFNNLLTGVLGNVSLVRRASPTDAPTLPQLEQIEALALRAADLCKQMLAYAGKGRFVVGPLQLNDLLQETVALLRLSVSRRAELVFDLAPDLPVVLADATQMRQIIMNLVINAAEALGDRNGQVRIATSLVQPDHEALRAEPFAPDLPEGDYVCLEVSDNGPGMSGEVKARIFEPFFTTKFTGRGLGLAAVLGIVRAHKGAITVDSTPGLGTTFKVLLPCAQPTETER